MSELITVRGFVASGVREDKTHSGDPVASFRMGATERRYNREDKTWEDGDTNWFSIACFRALAKNVAFSVQKGEKVVVTGRLKIRNWSLPDGRTGTTADIDAETVGHDLMWGLSKFKRVGKEDPAAWNSQQNQSGDVEGENPGLNMETGELPDGAPAATDGAQVTANEASYAGQSADDAHRISATDDGDEGQESDDAVDRDSAFVG
ncbi:single-stranded DNA-binding protein [Arthrobacter monumenti]